jgi:sortase A
MSRVRDAFGFLFGAWRLRPRSKRILSAVSILLALAGAGMLSYPFMTDIYSRSKQSRLADEFSSPDFRTAYRLRQVDPGQVLTRIKIDAISVDALIVEGTDSRALRAGAGHYRKTALPCEFGNVSIAGHRNTYGEPFNRLDELVEGDVIELLTPDRSCTYKILDGPVRSRRPTAGAAGWITHPQDVGVIAPLDGFFLTLTTCHPENSSSERLIIRAQLIASS